MTPAWTTDAAVRAALDLRSESPEWIAERTADFLTVVGEATGIGRWADGAEAWPATPHEQVAFVRARPDTSATGGVQAGHGWLLGVRGEEGGLRLDVSLQLGASSLGRRHPLHSVTVSTPEPGRWTPRQVDAIVEAATLFGPRFVAATTRRAGLAGRRGGWLAPDAHRLWIRSDAAELAQLPDRFTARQVAEGVLVSAPDDASVEALLASWADIRSTAGVDDLAPGDGARPPR